MMKNNPTGLVELNIMFQQKHERDGELFALSVIDPPQCRVNSINRVIFEEIFNNPELAPRVSGDLVLRALLNLKYPDEPNDFRRPFAIVDDTSNLYGYDIACNRQIEQQLVDGLPEFMGLAQNQIALVLGNEL